MNSQQDVRYATADSRDYYAINRRDWIKLDWNRSNALTRDKGPMTIARIVTTEIRTELALSDN